MNSRSAGDFDYETHGGGYAVRRRTDPRIAAHVHAALGDARTILNVGAGAGSYEPEDREVTAVEPSPSMRSQRPPHLAVAVDATAEDLPFADDSFDAAMAVITVHQWTDADRGLRELRRVSRGPVVVLTLDMDVMAQFWLADYVPELVAADRDRFPTVDHIVEVLGGAVEVTPIPIPADCVDGFIEAYYARPEQFLDPAVRRSQSGWGFVEPDVADRAVARLWADLASGEWHRRYGEATARPEYVGSLRLVVARP